MFPPERIVCLTEATVETLYPIGLLSEPEQRRAFFRPFSLPKTRVVIELVTLCNGVLQAGRCEAAQGRFCCFVYPATPHS